MGGLCGTCTACCRVFSIPKLKKPAGKWCEHCAIGQGCKIYEDRPDTCVDFTCMWLGSHLYGDGPGMPLEMRPDKCKVVFSPTTKDDVIAGTTMGRPDAWQKGPAREIIDKLIQGGMRVVLGESAAPNVIMITKEGIFDVEMTEPDENGIQWNKKKTARAR